MYGEDKPDERVIEDDVALDTWYKRYSDKRERSMASKFTGSQDAINSIPAYVPS